MLKRLFATTFILLSSVGFGQDTALADSIVTIGIKEAPPFVEIIRGSHPDGLSIDFWNEVEGNAQVIFEYRKFNDLNALLDALRAGEIDMSINPITVTEERMKQMDFSQPFYISGTAMVRQDSSKWLAVIKNFFSWQFFSALAALLLVILIFGFVVWLFERKRNREMFSPGARGIADGFWWSAVTMTTVGYGDKAPLTRGGRVVGFIWMFVGILLISGLTASIASALTVSNLESKVRSPEDLRRFDVGTITGSSSAGYLDIFKVNFDKYSSVDEGLKAVQSGEIEVFVYDRPILNHYMKNNDYEGLRLSNRDLKTDYYSFTYPKGSPLRDFLDPFLVKALKSESWSYRLKSENENE